MNDHPVNLGITQALVVEGPFLWTGRTLLDRIEVEPGDSLKVRPRPAPADEVEVLEEVALALRQVGAADRWKALTLGRRRGRVHRVETARTAPTRLKRIAALLAEIGLSD